MADRSIPPVLMGSPHLVAVEDAVTQAMDAIDISALMMYMVDTVHPDALPYLADQFDVSGYNGYRMAQTEQDRRNIIRNAIRIKRRIGTVWAIKQAMIAVGYGNAVLQEGAGTVGDGRDWARFTVVVNLGLQALDPTTPAKLTELINAYKNARSELIGISYTCDVSEILPVPSEALNVDFGVALSDELPLTDNKLNGSWTLNGSRKLTAGNEDLQVTII